MLEFRYDTQLLIEGENLDEDTITDYFTENFKGDCLLAVGDDELIKIHYHTNEPWKVLEYCASLGEIHDIVIEDMDRQARGLQVSTPFSPEAMKSRLTPAHAGKSDRGIISPPSTPPGIPFGTKAVQSFSRTSVLAP